MENFPGDHGKIIGLKCMIKMALNLLPRERDLFGLSALVSSSLSQLTWSDKDSMCP